MRKSFVHKGVIFILIILFVQFNSFSKPSIPFFMNGIHLSDTLPLKGFLFGDDEPYPECHASTIIHLKNGEFIAAWFGGTKEKDDDVGIWMTKGKPGNWSKTFEVAKINNTPHWNPVLFQAPGGKIYLFFKVGKEIPQWETWVKTSDDEGETWSDAKELVKGDHGGRGPVRNKILVLSDGTWLAGASNEQGMWNAFFDRSNDQGKTWTATPYLSIDRNKIKGKGIIQPTLWESSPGHVHALLRSSSGIICRSDSKDYGKTWSPVYKTSLPNPNSGIDVAKLSDGTLVLAYNPTTHDWGSRGRLSLAVSFDNCKSWPKKVDLENGKKDDEYSYPAIISFNDSVAVTYTYNRKKIAYWMATKDWIMHNAVPMENQPAEP
jgi:predicted neuraminidase